VVPEALTYVSFGGSNGGMVLDVSEGGLAVAAAFAIPAASLLEIAIPADVTHGAIEATGRVAWIAESKRRVGVQLVDVSPSTREYLRRWVAATQGVPPTMEPDTLGDWPPARAGWAMPADSEGAPLTAAPVPSAAKAISEELICDAEALPKEPAHPAPPAAVSTPAPANASRLNELPSARKSESRLTSEIAKTGQLRLAAALAMVVLVCFALGIVIGRSVLARWNYRHSATATVPPAPQSTVAARTTIPLQASTLVAPRANTRLPNTSENANSHGISNSLTISTVNGGAAEDAAEGALPGGEILVTPNEGDAPLRIDLGEEVIAHSPSLEIRSRRFAFVPAVTPRGHHKPRKERLEVGILTSRVTPQPPPASEAAGQTGEQSVAVRATIDGDGHVLNVDPLSGPNTLISSVMAAVREWRYDPSSLDGKPIETQVDLMIKFRPLR
jgi:PilZ domain/Gram-negative bacterial TonB protein C-terminal